MAPVGACGSCGQRRFDFADDPTLAYVLRPVSDLHLLAYSPAEIEDFASKHHLWQTVKSSFLSSTGTRYHLHPELVTADETVYLCKDCNDALAAGKKHPLSIAGGTDYGVWQRTGLRMPSLVESLCWQCNACTSSSSNSQPPLRLDMLVLCRRASGGTQWSSLTMQHAELRRYCG